MEQYREAFINFMITGGALRYGFFTPANGRRPPFFMSAGAGGTGAGILCVSAVMARFNLYVNKIRDTPTRKGGKDRAAAGILPPAPEKSLSERSPFRSAL